MCCSNYVLVGLRSYCEYVSTDPAPSSITSMVFPLTKNALHVPGSKLVFEALEARCLF